MAITKFLIPALSIASTAYAACSGSKPTTISNPEDARAIATCTTYSGDIVIESGAAEAGTVNLGDNLQKIDGDLTYENDDGVQTIRATSLESVTGDLTFGNMSGLSDTGLAKLESAGSLTFNGLQSLGQLGLASGLKEVGMVSIVNTVINSLTGISNVTKITGLEVSDNPYLDRISLDVEEIGMIMVGPNDVSSGGQTSSFLNLEKAGTIIIRNSSDVQFPKLANVTRHFELLGNTFQNFSAPELKVCGGLVINDNTRLVDLDFPKLTTIRSGNSTLTVANNTRLDEISAFKNLETVAGGVTFSGNFSKLPLDSISQISGALTVDTASSTFNCKPITELKEDGVVKGKDRCRMNDKTKIGGTGTGTTTSSDGSASSSESIASPMEIPASFMPVFTVLAGLLSFFM